MNTARKTNPAHFNSAAKAVAFRCFKGVRWVARQGARTPDHVRSLRRDIADAWKESARC